VKGALKKTAITEDHSDIMSIDLQLWRYSLYHKMATTQ